MPPPSPPQAGRSASSSSPYGGGSNMLMSVASAVSWRKTRAAAEGWAPSGTFSWLDSSERCQAFASFHAAARSTSATEVFDTAAVVTAASARSHDLSATAGPGGVGGASGLHQAHLDAPVAAVERCRGRWKWFFPLARFVIHGSVVKMMKGGARAPTRPQPAAAAWLPFCHCHCCRCFCCCRRWRQPPRTGTRTHVAPR